MAEGAAVERRLTANRHAGSNPALTAIFEVLMQETKYERDVHRAEIDAANRRRMQDPIYRAQTSMLQWLRGRSHQVDFSNDPVFTPELPGAPSRYIAPPDELSEYNGRPCPYCGDQMLIGSAKRPSRDHKLPRSRGGTLTNGNRLIVCAPCNNDKDDMTLEEFARYLSRRCDPRAGLVWNLVDRGG